MLRVSNHVICVTSNARFYSTKRAATLTRNINPIKSFNENGSITEVYVVRRSRLRKSRSKKANVSLSQRLKDILADDNWTQVPGDRSYERKPKEKERGKIDTVSLKSCQL